MAKKIRPGKRTTFAAIFGKTMIPVVAASLLFSGFQNFRVRMDSNDMNLCYQASERIKEKISNSLMYADEKYDNKESILNDCTFILNAFSTSTAENWITFDYAVADIISNKIFHTGSAFRNSYTFSRIEDSEGNVVASGRTTFITGIRTGTGQKNKLTVYDRNLHIPEMDSFFEEYNKIETEHKGFIYTDVNFSGIYYNSEKNVFIPEKGEIKISDGAPGVMPDEKPIKTFEFDIKLDDPAYEIIEKKSTSSEIEIDDKEYPFFSLNLLGGLSDRLYDEISSEKYKEQKNITAVNQEYPVIISGEEYNLCITALFDNNIYTHLVIINSAAFFIILTIIALLYSWRRSVLNKAQYRYEDYQKALTNNLAHDIKTPLTAISGYAESTLKKIKKGDTADAEKYLDAILENVGYTDSLVAKALELNRISEIKKINKTPVKLHELTAELLKKYELSLSEKNISVSVSGEATVSADKDSLYSAIENLISNAVNYTTENGKITVAMDGRTYSVKNSTSHKTDVKNLTQPFVRGDSSRSDGKGNGLGLAIVQNAADLNRINLTLDSTDSTFEAKLTF